MKCQITYVQVGINLLLCLMGVSASGQHVLSGRVYVGEYEAEPPAATALEGVLMQLYGSMDSGVAGVQIDSCMTSADGWYGLSTSAEYEFFTIICTGQMGHVFQGSSSVGGTASGEQIQYSIALEGKTLTGNKFWYLPEGGGVENQPPVVDAGPDQVHGSMQPVSLPFIADLAGSVTDDGLPGGDLWSEWLLVEGPDDVQFDDIHDPCTSAEFPHYGAYVLRLVAGDGEHEVSDDVLVEVLGKEDPPECLLRQDLDRNTVVDIRDMAIFASAWLQSSPQCRAETATGSQTAQQQMASVLVPAYMYYIERYFSDVPDKTEIDLQIKAILDESKSGRRFLLAALGNYQNTSSRTKELLYDPETLGATANITESIDLEFIRDRLADRVPGLAWASSGSPAAPTKVTATNASTWDEEFPAYQITLNWQDNADNEDGFRVYRVSKAKGTPKKAATQWQLIDTVGSNMTTYVDKLSPPADPNDQYCYQVVAYNINLVTLVGQPAEIIESEPSNGACAFYSTSPPTAPVDTDGDGVPDFLDDCPSFSGVLTHGCPDADLDGIPNIVEGSGTPSDMCPTQKGLPQGKYIPANRHGCPQQYNLRWMKMEVKNNTGGYLYPGYKFIPDKGLYANESDSKYGDGEEPYLLFSFINGKFQGMPAAWTSQWCCGEEVNVAKGNTTEPDSDSRGEENPGQLNNLLANGLTVFPGVGSFDVVDNELGLAMTVSLMERDYDITVVQDQADAFTAAIKSGKAVVDAVAGCIGSGGAGCLGSIGAAMKTIVEEIFNLSKKPQTVTIDDPDDFEGANAWAITAFEAYSKTSTNGAYAFYMDMPTSVMTSCLGWMPCPVGSGVPITMQVRVYFCLYRQGIPEADIQKVCTPYIWVVPLK